MRTTWNPARTAATAGFACAALLVADIVGSPELGQPGDSAPTLVHYSRAAGGSPAVWGAVSALSVIALVVMLWSIGRLAQGRTQDRTSSVVAVVGAAGLFVAVGIDHLADVAAYYVVGHVADPAGAVTTLAAVRFASSPLASLSIAVATGAVALGALHSRALSRPIAVFGLVVAALNLLGSFSGGRSGTFELNNGLFVFLGLFGFLVWNLTAATSLLRRSRHRAPAAAGAPGLAAATA